MIDEKSEMIKTLFRLADNVHCDAIYFSMEDSCCFYNGSCDWPISWMSTSVSQSGVASLTGSRSFPSVISPYFDLPPFLLRSFYSYRQNITVYRLSDLLNLW